MIKRIFFVFLLAFLFAGPTLANDDKWSRKGIDNHTAAAGNTYEIKATGTGTTEVLATIGCHNILLWTVSLVGTYDIEWCVTNAGVSCRPVNFTSPLIAADTSGLQIELTAAFIRINQVSGTNVIYQAVCR